MKKIYFFLLLVSRIGFGYAQSTGFFMGIPRDLVVEGVGGSRAGTCSSPDGTIECDQLTSYPSKSYAENNDCCYFISPADKNIDFCFTFTAINSSVSLDAYVFWTYITGYTVTFSGFDLYTCDPDCSWVGSGFSFTGLTVGACYTWCFNLLMTGGGPGVGFTEVCPLAFQTPVLPVELVNFDCLPDPQHITLTWETQSELNCESFKIMRSEDGVNFEEIASIPGNGTSTTSHVYIYTDDSPFPGNNYYMLKEVDYFNAGEIFTDVITCSTEDPVIEIYNYNLFGEIVDINNVPNGLYIRESVTASKRHIRQLFYKY